MKKAITTIAAILLLAVCSFGQSGKNIYNRYSDAKDVSAVFISQTMFRMIGRIPELPVGDGKVDISPIIRTLDGFYLIDSENISINKAIREDTKRFVSDGRFNLLLEVKDDGERVHFYTVEKGDIITNLVMTSDEDDEFVFISLDGAIPREKFEELLANPAIAEMIQ